MRLHYVRNNVMNIINNQCVYCFTAVKNYLYNLKDYGFYYLDKIVNRTLKKYQDEIKYTKKVSRYYT